MKIKVEEFESFQNGSKRIEVTYDNGKGLWDGPQRITVHSNKDGISKIFLDMSNYENHRGKDDEIDNIVDFVSSNLLAGNFSQSDIGNDLEISFDQNQS